MPTEEPNSADATPTPAPQQSTASTPSSPADATAPAPAAPSAAPAPAAGHSGAGLPPAFSSNPLELVRPSLEAFKLAWRPIVALILLLLLCAGLAGGAIFLGVFNASLRPVLLLLGVVVLVATMIYLPWATTKVLLEAARGHALSIRETMPPTFMDGLKLFGTALLTGLVVVGGFLLFIVPGIIFLGWFAFTAQVAVDEHIFGVAALKRSRDLARGHWWEVMGAVLLQSAVSIITIIPILGALAYIVASFILTAVPSLRYLQLKSLKASGATDDTPVHWANYAVIGVAVLATILTNSFSKPPTTLDTNPSGIQTNGGPYGPSK
jgi:hypothetical protein